MCVHAFIGLFDFLQLVMLFYFHVSRSNDAAIEYFEIEPNRIDFFSFFSLFFFSFVVIVTKYPNPSGSK